MTIKDPIAQYFENISVYPLLTAEQEVELATTYRNTALDDETRNEARETLITSNLRLVVSIAKKYRNFHLSLNDFIQAGNRGLMKAVEMYDPTLINATTNKPYRFSTYAGNWIKQAIAKEIADNGRIIRNPANIIAAITKYNAFISKFTQAHGGITPTDQEIAENLNIDVATVQNYKRWSADTASLDGIVVSNGDGKDVSLIDFVADDAPTPDEVAAQNDEERLCKERFDRLDDRTKLFITLKYGLGSDYLPKCDDLSKIKGLKRIPTSEEPLNPAEPHTLEEISQLFGLTRERIRQLIVAGVK